MNLVLIHNNGAEAIPVLFNLKVDNITIPKADSSLRNRELSILQFSVCRIKFNRCFQERT